MLVKYLSCGYIDATSVPVSAGEYCKFLMPILLYLPYKIFALFMLIPRHIVAFFNFKINKIEQHGEANNNREMNDDAASVVSADSDISNDGGAAYLCGSTCSHY